MTEAEGYGARLTGGALWYGQNGWKVMPCHGVTEDGRCTCGQPHSDPKDMGKHPAIAAWQNSATSDQLQIGAWWRDNPLYNIGIMCRDSGFFVIDIDPRSGGDESFDEFERLIEGELPPTVEAITGEYHLRGKVRRGRHLIYKCDPSEQLIGKLDALNLKGIDIKHNGYILVSPSNHISGVTYTWKPGHAPWEIPVAEAPEKLLEPLRKRSRRSSSGSGSGGQANGWEWIGDLEFAGNKIDIDKLMTEGIDEGSRAVDIYALACALANKYGTSPMDRKNIETMMMRFNHEMVRPPLEVDGPGGLLMHVHRALDFVDENPKFRHLGWDANNTNERASTALSWAENAQATERAAAASSAAPVSQEPNTVRGAVVPVSTSDPDDLAMNYTDTRLPGTFGGTVDAILRQGGSAAAAASSLAVPKDPDALTAEEGGDPGRRSLSDTGNGRRLVDNFGSAIRYTPGLGWFAWNGGYWRPDTENLEVRELSKRIASTIASEVNNYETPEKKGEVLKWANEAKSNGRLRGTIESATSDPRVIVDVENWDSNPEMLGVHNGVVDLRTGILHKGNPDLYITRRAPASYTPGLRNARWENFIDYATGGDKELQAWLQKAAGYSLTGLRTHDAMFLVYGPPGSGKNTFVEALVKCLGTNQYAWPLDSSILAMDNGQSSGADLYHWAELRGRRMVWVDELPDGERLKENSVKKLTGSSEISARSPGEKPFSFESQAKLWVTTNHRPVITDDAMWRRIRPIPWTNVPTTPDPDLKEYLFDPEGGLPAVLAWAVEGAVRLLASKDRDNLGTCKAVQDAGEVYRKNEDRIGMFLNEETSEVAGASLPLKALYTVYTFWSSERGEKALTRIAFDRKLADRGHNIKGEGARAEIIGRSLVPRTVAGNGQIDWEAASRFAR